MAKPEWRKRLPVSDPQARSRAPVAASSSAAAAGRSARFLLIRDPYEHWGFPKGHLEGEETPAEAALRETAEETGLDDLLLHGPIRIIDWHFRFRGRYIHKYCHFFLFESPAARGGAADRMRASPTSAGCTLEEALEQLSYDNARGVLKRAGEMARTLVAMGAGRPRREPGRPPPPAYRRSPECRSSPRWCRRRRRPGAPAHRCPRRARGRWSRCRSAAPAGAALDHPAGRCGGLLAHRHAAGRPGCGCGPRFPQVPWMAFAPFRPDDGELLAACRRRGVGAGPGRGRGQRGGRRPGGPALRRRRAAPAPWPMRRGCCGSPSRCSGRSGTYLLARVDQPVRTGEIARQPGLLPGAPVPAVRGRGRAQPQAGHRSDPDRLRRGRCSATRATTSPPSPGSSASPPPATWPPPPAGSPGSPAGGLARAGSARGAGRFARGKTRSRV